MIAAFACYENRLAALLDTAVQFQLYRLEQDSPTALERLTLPQALPPAGLLDALSHRGVQVVVCGAVSEHLSALFAHSGLELVPWVCGELGILSQALARGELHEYAMPGCCGRRRMRCPGGPQGRGGGPGSGRGAGRGGGPGSGSGGRGGGRGGRRFQP